MKVVILALFILSLKLVKSDDNIFDEKNDDIDLCVKALPHKKYKQFLNCLEMIPNFTRNIFADGISNLVGGFQCDATQNSMQKNFCIVLGVEEIPIDFKDILKYKLRLISTIFNPISSPNQIMDLSGMTSEPSSSRSLTCPSLSLTCPTLTCPTLNCPSQRIHCECPACVECPECRRICDGSQK